jgi:hypothetical protein
MQAVLKSYTESYNEVTQELRANMDDAKKDYNKTVEALASEQSRALGALQEEITEGKYEKLDTEKWEKSRMAQIETFLDTIDYEPPEKTLKAINEKLKPETYQTLDDAKEAMEKALKEAMEAGIKDPKQRDAFDKTLTSYGEAISRSRKEILNGLGAPDAIQNRILIERFNLLSGRTVSDNEQDKLLIRFLNEKKEATPEVMKAVRNIRARYEKTYTDQYQKGLEKVKTVTYSGNPERPTGHDLAARLLALIMLAKEAEEKFDTAAYAEIKADDPKQQSPPNLNFQVPNMRHPGKYIPRVMRHGFTMAGIGKAALTVGAWGALVTNLMNYDKSQGNLFTEKGFENFINNITSNPYIAGSAAVLYGKRMYEQTPGVLKLARLGGNSEGETTLILTQKNLDGIQVKLNNEKCGGALTALIGSKTSAYEWKIMEKIDQNKAKQLMKSAEKANSKFPKITAEMLQTLMGSDADLNGAAYLIGTGNDSEVAHARYLFYKEFLTAKDVNITKLKQDTNQWLSFRA